MPLKMNSKSILAILLVLGISAALIVVAISLSMGRAPMKKSVAAAQDLVEIDYFGPGECRDTAVDSSGNIYADGFILIDGVMNATLRKYTSDGENIWTRNPAADYGGNTTANAVAIDASGNVLTAGNIERSHPDAKKSDDGHITLHDSNGNKIWSTIVRFSGIAVDVEDIRDLAVSVDSTRGWLSGILLPGLERAREAERAIRIEDGIPLELVTLEVDVFGESKGKAIATDPNLGYYVGCDVEKRSADSSITNDIMIIKRTSFGNVAWMSFYGGSGTIERTNGIYVDSDGDVYLFGESGTDPNRDAIIVKFNGWNGNIIWQLEPSLSGDGTADGGYVINDSLVVYGTKDKNVCQIVYDANTGSEIRSQIFETEYWYDVNAVSHGPIRDALATTRTNPAGEKEGVLLSCLSPVWEPAETPIGNDITVYPNPYVTVNFEQVTYPGVTSATFTTGRTLPGCEIVGQAYDITTTAITEGNITLTIKYDQNDIAPENEQYLEIAKLIAVQLWPTVLPIKGYVEDAFDKVSATLEAGGLSTYEVLYIAEPVPALEFLIDEVYRINESRGIPPSLDAKLQAAKKALSDLNQNNDIAAVNNLQAFINEVEAQRGKDIPENEADYLIAWAKFILKRLQ